MSGVFLNHILCNGGSSWRLFMKARNSRTEVFCKKDFLRNFAKFKGKHLCQSLFFNKVAELRSATLLEKRFWHKCFPVNFMRFWRTAFFMEQLCWLLLEGSSYISLFVWVLHHCHKTMILPFFVLF